METSGLPVAPQVVSMIFQIVLGLPFAQLPVCVCWGGGCSMPVGSPDSLQLPAHAACSDPLGSGAHGLTTSSPRPDGDLGRVLSFQPEQTLLTYQAPGKTLFFHKISFISSFLKHKALLGDLAFSLFGRARRSE